MRLIVKQNDINVSEFQFSQGPIQIGRLSSSHICLPNGAVSKEHAVIFTDQDGKWVVEDLGSTNKTYLNEKEVQKAEIKTGDVLRIKDFVIEVIIEETIDHGKSADLEDTLNLQASLATPPHEIIIRKADSGHAPAMRLAAGRLTDFSKATEAICEVDTIEKLLQTLLTITLKQFNAFHAWCALREQPNGPMIYQTGKRRDGRTVELKDLILSDKIAQAIERKQSLVLPRVSAQIEDKERLRSALIAPIIRSTGCFGIIYADNAMIHDHYSLSDLDYLMLLAMHTASVLKRFLNT
jgi:pSer/pThr/pTyr-binding forkhead associated (FHA) protein